MLPKGLLDINSRIYVFEPEPEPLEPQPDLNLNLNLNPKISAFVEPVINPGALHAQ